MAGESSHLPKVMFIPVNSGMENLMAGGNSSMTTATSTKEIFWKTSCTDRGNITTQTGIFTRENSKMIHPMDKGSMSWKMEISIREPGNKEGWFPDA